MRPPGSVYRWLILTALAVNVAVAWTVIRDHSLRLDDGSSLPVLSGATLVNVAIAVAARQQPILNAIYLAVGRGRTDRPLGLRWAVSKVHHIGGLHAGAAIAACGWMVAFVLSAWSTRRAQPIAVTATTLWLSVLVTALILTMVMCSLPIVRIRAHNVFEFSHRWCGWAAIGGYWALTLHLASRTASGASTATTLASDWRVWTLAVITVWVAWPWLRLRRVPIRVERPSRHVAIVEFGHGVRPVHTSAIAVSRRPLGEWHAFATITSPGRPGFRIVISRAGDWTGRFIDDPPTHVWLRGTPVVAPMAQAARLYRRVVYVVTGSGIGPLLGQILADRVPARMVWSTRSPRGTYGNALVEEVERAQPDAVVWDTTTSGTPDLLQLALDAVDEFRAEAVFVVSNKTTTLRLVRDLERQGIPAFGPIWDS